MPSFETVPCPQCHGSGRVPREYLWIRDRAAYDKAWWLRLPYRLIGEKDPVSGRTIPDGDYHIVKIVTPRDESGRDGPTEVWVAPWQGR